MDKVPEPIERAANSKIVEPLGWRFARTDSEPWKVVEHSNRKHRNRWSDRCHRDLQDISELKPFIIIEPETLKPVVEDGWEEVEMGVDSGATETVIRRKDLSWVKTT